MDFAKYVSLLSSRSLFFARADSLQDRFEGAKGILRNKTHWDTKLFEYFCNSIREVNTFYEKDQTELQVTTDAQKLVRDIEMSGNFSRKHTFIS